MFIYTSLSESYSNKEGIRTEGIEEYWGEDIKRVSISGNKLLGANNFERTRNWGIYHYYYFIGKT